MSSTIHYTRLLSLFGRKSRSISLNTSQTLSPSLRRTFNSLPPLLQQPQPQSQRIKLVQTSESKNPTRPSSLNPSSITKDSPAVDKSQFTVDPLTKVLKNPADAARLSTKDFASDTVIYRSNHGRAFKVSNTKYSSLPPLTLGYYIGAVLSVVFWFALAGQVYVVGEIERRNRQTSDQKRQLVTSSLSPSTPSAQNPSPASSASPAPQHPTSTSKDFIPTLDGLVGGEATVWDNERIGRTAKAVVIGCMGVALLVAVHRYASKYVLSLTVHPTTSTVKVQNANLIGRKTHTYPISSLSLSERVYTGLGQSKTEKFLPETLPRWRIPLEQIRQANLDLEVRSDDGAGKVERKFWVDRVGTFIDPGVVDDLLFREGEVKE
ncbi:hypothetical protein HK097_000751 [Rhizophlyctis rosea]|uniref:Uncharacterized protein n=1 Tax=Rhizophlyctis rosea TaxID=64517 RepID=A0AAD5SDC2_9FUNG|nr:hypothetical protein HK097_000751 [Rhizophlyctis rosea]